MENETSPELIEINKEFDAVEYTTNNIKQLNNILLSCKNKLNKNNARQIISNFIRYYMEINKIIQLYFHIVRMDMAYSDIPNNYIERNKNILINSINTLLQHDKIINEFVKEQIKGKVENVIMEFYEKKCVEKIKRIDLTQL